MYNGVKVLDVHSHIRWQPAAMTFMNQLIISNHPIKSPIEGGKSVDPKSRQAAGMLDEDWQAAADSHAAYLDVRNIDTQILGPHPVEVNGWLPRHIFESWTRYVNDSIFKMTQLRPDKFTGAAQLPQVATESDTRHVLPELERCVKEYGFVAAYASPDITGRRDTPGMHEAYWYPLYEKCQELGIPLVVHGTDGQDPRFHVMPHNYQLAFATEQFITTYLLRWGDQFKRFPELRIIMCHMGGGLDRFIKQSNALNPENDTTNNLFFDSCAYDVDYLATGIKQRGVSQVCFGVEAPGSGQTIRPETGKSSDDLVPVIAGLDFLSEQDKIDIFHNNPARVCHGLSTAAGSEAHIHPVLANSISGNGSGEHLEKAALS
ncbi:MAG: amidohydrolase [Acidimicrobiaceae bacterium]|nr:amidohydrolase [Acidimicrobiaceae bacterium]